MNFSSVMKQKVPESLRVRLKHISQLSSSLQLHPYLVGGVVRDLLLSVPLKKDFDVTVSGGSVFPLASLLASKWKLKLLSYPEFLTFTIEFKDGTHIDLITARQESYPYPGSLPVVESGSLQEDLLRRDFSINAIALSLSRESYGQLYDPAGGFSDLKRKKIRVLHSESFRDDPTRIFRAARFAGRFGFRLEKNTAFLIDRSVKNQDIKKISCDRIRVELQKIMLEEYPASALKFLSQWKVLKQVHPKLSWNPRLHKMFQRGSESILPDLQDRRSRKTDPEKGEKLLRVRMALLLSKNSLLEAKEILNGLNFPKMVQEKILQPLTLYHLFLEKRSTTTLPRLKLFEETDCFFNLFTNSNIVQRWNDYRIWVKCRPHLNGESLKKFGFFPGPLFKKILESLTTAKFEGKVKNRSEEVRFVVDNFRREL